MANWKNTHQKYQSLVGAEYIATPKALRIVERLCREREAQTCVVVEIGTGIGTFADLILSEKSFMYFAYEINQFCVKQLKNNLSMFQFTLSTTYDRLIDELSRIMTVSEVLIVVDDYLDENQTNKMLEIVRKKCSKLTIFIEGHRFGQRRLFVNACKRNNMTFHARFFGNSLDSVKGGFLLSCMTDSTKVGKYQSQILSGYSDLRLKIHDYYFTRKTFSALGIRKRKWLGYLPRLSKRS